MTRNCIYRGKGIYYGWTIHKIIPDSGTAFYEIRHLATGKYCTVVKDEFGNLEYTPDIIMPNKIIKVANQLIF